MVELTIKDADSIIRYLRDKLEKLNVRKQTIIDTKESYINKDNPLINELVKAIPDNQKEQFNQFNLSCFENDYKKVIDEITEIENYILILTAGSDKE